MVQTLEAWMPEMIASHKLRGFVQDVGGVVLESVPGRIRVRLGDKGSIYQASRNSLAWLGFGRRSSLVELEMRLELRGPEPRRPAAHHGRAQTARPRPRRRRRVAGPLDADLLRSAPTSWGRRRNGASGIMFLPRQQTESVARCVSEG